MGKYAVSKEFQILKGMKLPGRPELLPMVNTFLELMRGRSDERVIVKKQVISGCRNEQISVYIIKPRELDVLSPCLFDIHGGGFMMKASLAHFMRAKEYAYKLNCTVIFPDYRLIPKNPYPIPLEDCYGTYVWMLEHKEELQIDTDRIAVLGDSAGGNLAAALSLLVRDRGLPKPCFQLLLYPVTDRRMQTESMKVYTDTPVWDAKLSKLMWELYLAGVNKSEDSEETGKRAEVFEDGRKRMESKDIGYISPAEAADFSGMPPTYIEVADFDCLRDEGILFAGKLKDAGVPVELHKIDGSVHGYDVITRSKTVKRFMQRRIVILRKAFKMFK